MAVAVVAAMRLAVTRGLVAPRVATRRPVRAVPPAEPRLAEVVTQVLASVRACSGTVTSANWPSLCEIHSETWFLLNESMELLRPATVLFLPQNVLMEHTSVYGDKQRTDVNAYAGVSSYESA